ncbi:MAG: proteinase inhibitor, partial [Polyangiales bacterium]
PSNWFIDAPGNWTDTFNDSGLALGAGWIDSRALGAYPPAENNGFDRINSGFPTTNPERMRAFFEAELMHRGRTRESFARAEPFGGPIYDQLVFRPSACAPGVGVDASGSITWTGGRARYLYVLDASAESPGVPPNLDLPTGTRWRVDVAPTDAPLASGVTYGQVPMGATQRFPATGAPVALSAGQTYYLYVLADVGIPLTRCLFTAPR